MDDPVDLLHASRHADPYPWYARLRRGRGGLHFDEALGLWVAADEDAIRAALAHAALRVRPPHEPVPAALRGTAAGEVFAHLVRMNDGDFHARHRPVLVARAAGWRRAAVEAAAQAAARDFVARGDPDAFLSGVPVQAMARLLGVAQAELDATVAQVQDFVRAIAPGADAGAVAAGDRAARALLAQGAALGLDLADAANRIACMQQALDATAGLIGNTVLALRRRPRPVAEAVAATARDDPAIHHTRRWAAQDLQLAGARIAAGQGVLVLLAAAPGLGFGDGPHRCPGEAAALAIAAAALASFADARERDRFFGAHAGYRALPHARIPVFAPQGEPA